MSTCPICYNPNADTEPWEGMIRCKDHEACGKYLREVFMAPVTNMEHPRLAGLPEFAQDVCARQGNPLLMVGGGSLNLSELCHMMIGEGQVREVEKYRAILKRIAGLHVQLVDEEGSINVEIARLLEDMPEETVECVTCEERIRISDRHCPCCGTPRA
jgi:hypothetical protein